MAFIPQRAGRDQHPDDRVLHGVQSVVAVAQSGSGETEGVFGDGVEELLQRRWRER
jgi:hypothetical protein